MSFLDRFQGKIATVTAHGHLKKADGSEEIRVGLPKRKPNAAAQPSAKATSNQAMAVPPDRVVVQRHPPQPQQYAPPEVPRVAIPQAKGHATMDKTASARQQPQYASPQSSPRHKSGRDGYENYGYDRDNNSHYRPHHQQQQQPYGQASHRYSGGGGYDYQASLPGRAVEDHYEGHYDQHYSGAPRRGGGGHSPVKGASPERYHDKSPSHYERPKDRSPVNQQREPPSPRERNEARVQSDEDQLAFSRRARPVQFAPCTVAQYKKEKPAGYYELGKLQPDLNAEDLVQKRANRERIKAFSKNLRDINKSVAAPKKADDDATQKKTLSTREKALAFAKHIPKPRLQQRPLAEPIGSLGASDSNDELDVDVPTAAARRPINSIEDDDTEEDHVSSELQQLQMRHQASRAQVEALIRGT
ncbi:hypothetical protein P43SY_007768 [Pythium insidiosum]|uniref:Uncharacterized protein n=1 Tax=Pythium insidiosum TaxID=114742 RepID=A0AAD5Q419_PYTIN|nr:hypothetical protein P43SY_007768 [Pythium insidiosum]